MTGGRIISLGECMVELSPAGTGQYRQGFAGDTFNSAWYLRRLLSDDWVVAYVTCIGTDRISGRMSDFIAGAGIDTSAIRRLPDRTVGLYMIDLEDGERSFSYWRGESAARRLAADPDWLAEALQGARLVLFSGITVAILPESDREALISVIATARAQGSVIAFDPNLRPRLWPDGATMCRWTTRAAAIADIVLPSFDEERLHFGDATPQATITRYRGAAAGTVAVKNGADAIHAWDARDGVAVLHPRPVRPVDTTAAGDAFNAGFLATVLQGGHLQDALRAGADLSRHVVQAAGALVATPAEPTGR